MELSLLRRHTALFALLPALCETGCVALAYAAALPFVQGPGEPFAALAREHIGWPVTLIIVWYVQAFDHRLYFSRRSDALVPQLADVTRAAFMAVLITLFIMAMLRPESVDRLFVLLFCANTLFLLLLFRLVARLGLWGLRGRGYNYRQVIIVGANERTREMVQVILSHEHYGPPYRGLPR